MARWPITNSSLSIPTHTTVTSGLPSGLMVARWANGPVATSSQTDCGICILDLRNCPPLLNLTFKRPSSTTSKRDSLNGLQDKGFKGLLAHSISPKDTVDKRLLRVNNLVLLESQ